MAYDRRIADAGGVDLFAVAIGGGDGHVVFDPPGTLRESYTRIGEFADPNRRDNLGIFPEFAPDAVSTHGVSIGLVTAAAVRVWADVAAATGNLVYPLGVPHQVATEQDEE